MVPLDGRGSRSADDRGTTDGATTDRLSNARAGTDPGAERGGIDVFDGLFVRQPIRPGHADAVRGLVGAVVSDWSDGDARTLVPVDGTNVVTLFLEPGDPDRLVWFLELRDDDAPVWDAPARQLRSSPLFDAGLDDHLADGTTVHADGVAGHQSITHATHPRRQRLYARQCGASLIAPVAGDELPVAVAETTVPLKPGLPSRIAAGAVTLGTLVKRFDVVRNGLRDRTRTLEAEAMYTETLLLEPAGDRRVLHYYMETQSQERLYEAYEQSSDLEVRFSDWAMRRLFEDPAEFVEFPLESDGEVLVHAVDPGRP